VKKYGLKYTGIAFLYCDGEVGVAHPKYPYITPVLLYNTSAVGAYYCTRV
jgi:hypothetical protein